MIPAEDASNKNIRLSHRARNLVSALGLISAVLDRDRRISSLLLASFLVGAVYCCWIFDIGFLTGHSGFWINSRDMRGVVGADISTALSGYYFFVREHWQLPLFHVDGLGIPQGVSIIFTDSIPIVALLGRLIYQITGEVFNLFGWWVAACYILAGMSLTALVAILGQRSLLSAVSATIIALCMPPLLWRWGHMALLAHFEIVIALIFYFVCKMRQNPAQFCFVAGTPLLVLALWTNPYLFLAAGGMVASGIGQAILDRRLTGVVGCAVVLGIMVIVATVMLLSGYLETPGSVAGAGFGYYSLNLISPISPQMSGLFPARRTFVLDATGGQYEGFSY